MEPIFSTIVEVVAEYYSVTPELIWSRDRHRSASTSRALAMYLARQMEFSFPEIGEAFQRDPTTVMWACERISSRKVKDEEFRQAVDRLIAQVKGTGLPARSVRIRSELMDLLTARVRLGIYGTSIEDLVDRIVCEYFQREQVGK